MCIISPEELAKAIERVREFGSTIPEPMKMKELEENSYEISPTLFDIDTSISQEEIIQRFNEAIERLGRESNV